ncbi:MAG TPA: hypothetical protein VII84_09070 [Acidimicrobiales bacterium]
MRSCTNRRYTPTRALINFMFNKKPSGYSSLVPRDSQGRRSKPFFFNGNGRGR